MINIGIDVLSYELIGDDTVHVGEKGDPQTLCGLTKRNNILKIGATPTCRNCWGRLYLTLSVRADEFFGYPDSGDVEERQTA